MTVRTIRAYKRYAVRKAVELRRADGASMRGLMIELSANGCRISNLGDTMPSPGDEIEIHGDAGFELSGIVRWSRDGLAGLKLAQSIHAPDMERIMESTCDGGLDKPRRYGT